MKTKILFIALILVVGCLRAQSPGDFDLSFSADGFVTNGAAVDGDQPELFLMADGRIVIGGTAYDPGTSANHFQVQRYLSDGSLDTSFAHTGQLLTSNAYTAIASGTGAIALQPDGKVVIVDGYYDGTQYQFYLQRILVDGTDDMSFGQSGFVHSNIPTASFCRPNQVLLLSSGKLLVVGNFEDNYVHGFFAARYNSDGTVDGTYGNGGMSKTYFQTLYVHDVRKSILTATDDVIMMGHVSGSGVTYHNRLMKLDANGNLDPSFGAGGFLEIQPLSFMDECYGLAVNAQGELYVSGTGPSGPRGTMAVRKFSASGVLDTNYGNGGIAELNDGFADDMGMDLVALADGSILVGGAAEGLPVGSRFFVAHLLADGTPDLPFGMGGIATPLMTSAGDFSEGWNLVLQPDGKILVAGISIPSTQQGSNLDAKFTLARYHGVTGTNAVSSKSMLDIAVYPNPVVGRAKIEVKADENTAVHVALLDMVGRPVETFFAGNYYGGGRHQFILNTDHLAAGTYYVQLHVGETTEIRKIAVVR